MRPKLNTSTSSARRSPLFRNPPSSPQAVCVKVGGASYMGALNPLTEGPNPLSWRDGVCRRLAFGGQLLLTPYHPSMGDQRRYGRCDRFFRSPEFPVFITHLLAADAICTPRRWKLQVWFTGGFHAPTTPASIPPPSSQQITPKL